MSQPSGSGSGGGSGGGGGGGGSPGRGLLHVQASSPGTTPPRSSALLAGGANDPHPLTTSDGGGGGGHPPRRGSGGSGTYASLTMSEPRSPGGADSKRQPFLQVEEPEPDIPMATPEHRRQHYSKEFTHKEYVKMAEIESLDYHLIHNDLFREDQWNSTETGYAREEAFRLLVSCLIGLTVGIIGFLIHTSVEAILDRKFDTMQNSTYSISLTDLSLSSSLDLIF